ncbi:hypothetical protein FUAX_51410 (plasmid) [Fulvitalea axinellae]|uniref:Uncharacterized protein n=1 Tax=Fulvitalea axinellae TaxID=1182444 RepID=A0AAU9DE52_9BACT|nr:hypothetical protein FUAX_51410 [Fulvitalea axinellae]
MRMNIRGTKMIFAGRSAVFTRFVWLDGPLMLKFILISPSVRDSPPAFGLVPYVFILHTFLNGIPRGETAKRTFS